MGIPHGTEEWHAARRTLLTASDCAAVLGEHPHSTPWKVWAAKRLGLEEDIAPGYSLRGQYLERGVAQWFAAESGARLWDSPGLESKDGWLGATIDAGLLVEGRDGEGVLEVKTTDEINTSEWEGGIPVWPAIQCQIGMEVMGRNWGAVVALCGLGPDPLRWSWCERDEDFLSAALPRLRKWWERHVRDGEEPKATWRDRKAIGRAYPDSVAESVTFPEALDDKARELLELKDRLKQETQRGEDLAAELQAYMKNAEEAHGLGYRITYRTGKRARPFRIVAD